MTYSIKSKKRKMVILVNSIEKETSLIINEIMKSLYEYFYFSYKNCSVSILPVVVL